MPKTITNVGRSMDEITASVRIHMRNMVNNALELGLDLTEAKETCGHGEWLPWLKSVGISSSTAANYMRISREIGADSKLAGLPYTKILALLTVPAEEREALADAAENMSAAEIRRLTEERNRAAEAANAESVRADQAEADAKEFNQENAHLRTEIQSLQAKLENEYAERHKREMAQLSAAERLKRQCHENEAKMDEKEEEMQRLLKECDEEARAEEREKLKDEINELSQKLEHEHARLLFAENNRIEVEVAPKDYDQLKRSQQELLDAAAQAEERAAAAEAELDAMRTGKTAEDIGRTLRIAVNTFMVDCQTMPGKPDQLIRSREGVERSVKLIESWCSAMRDALTLHQAEGAVV